MLCLYVLNPNPHLNGKGMQQLLSQDREWSNRQLPEWKEYLTKDSMINNSFDNSYANGHKRTRLFCLCWINLSSQCCHWKWLCEDSQNFFKVRNMIMRSQWKLSKQTSLIYQRKCHLFSLHICRHRQQCTPCQWY